MRRALRISVPTLLKNIYMMMIAHYTLETTDDPHIFRAEYGTFTELVLVFVDFALVALRRFLAIFLKTYPRGMRSITLESSVA